MSQVMETTETEALFQSTREALIFAFNYADQQFARSSMAQLYRKPGSGRGLVGVDGAGEAGMIMAEVMRLPLLQQHALCVRFTLVRSECRCCGHEVDTPQVREAVASMIQLALQHSPNAPLAVVRAVVRDYFGLQPMGNSRVLADQQGLHRNTVGTHKGQILRALRSVERQAERGIDKQLRDSGKVMG